MCVIETVSALDFAHAFNILCAFDFGLQIIYNMFHWIIYACRLCRPCGTGYPRHPSKKRQGAGVIQLLDFTGLHVWMLQYSSSQPSHSPEPIAKTCKNPWFLPFSQEKQMISVSPWAVRRRLVPRPVSPSSRGRTVTFVGSKIADESPKLHILDDLEHWLVGGLEHLDDFSIYWE